MSTSTSTQPFSLTRSPPPFYLTRIVNANPIQYLRTQLKKDQTSCQARISHVIKSEVITRVIALFTSVFAAADTLIHLGIGLGKGACCLAKKDYTKEQVYEQFKVAGTFALVTILGSIICVIAPGFDSSKSENGSHKNIQIIELT